MAKTNEMRSPATPAPLRVARVFPAPRALVFKAWSTSDHVKRWFCPEGFTAPQAKVLMRAGGPFELCMRAPDGTEHWLRGAVVEVVPPERLVLDLVVSDAQDHALFGAFTEVTLADAEGGTRMEVVQTYTVLDPAFAWMPEGAPRGWASTLDKLAAELTRMQSGVVERSVVHGSFTLSRTYDAPVARVYKALSDPAAKARWFAGEPGRCEVLVREMDFRVGGRERLQGRWEGGLVSTFDAIYHDIVPRERIVYSYEMHLDDRKISVSLATLELRPQADGRTTLKVTEHGAFLDGYDDAGSREHGTGILLDRLGESLRDGD